MVEISNGYVRKDKGYWRAVVCYQYGGAQRKVSKSTRVRCHPDRRDASGRITHRDNRGKGAAEEFLRRWRDELVAELAREPEPEASETSLYDYARGYYDLLHVKESTRSGYRAALSHLASTDADNARLRDLTASDQGRITELEGQASALTAVHEELAARVCELEGAAAESDQLRARLMEADEHLRGRVGKLEESRRARDELAARLEDALTEAGRERKSREDSERLVRQLSERLRRYATSGRTCDGADGEEDAITWRAFETDHHPISDAPTPEAADREGAWRLPRLRDKVANSVAASRALRRNDH